MRVLWLVLALGLAHPGGLASAPDSAPSEGGLFSSYDLLELTLEAPFSELFEKAKRDGDFSARGTLSYAVPGSNERVRIDGVGVSTRGHTSMREGQCTFPKLKLKFSAVRPTSLFDGMTTVKIGTHCADRRDDDLTRRYGRWANEKAAHREALVYRLLDVLEVTSLKARPARITYLDGQKSDGPLVRDAMLLEDDKEAIKRLGGARQIPPLEFGSARGTFSDADTAKLALAEALIGNFDWCLRFYLGDTYRCDARHALWNVLAVGRADGGVIPLIHDFDLSGMVVGRHPWFHRVYNDSFAASPAEIEVLGQVQRTRSLFTRPVLDGARASFVARKRAAYQALEQASLDDGWQSTIASYLDAFFAAIETDQAFYRPVVVDPRARAYIDAAATQPVCGQGSVPQGTPVSAPVATRGEMSRVIVLDALWHWASKKECVAVRNGPVWIATNTIDTDYPK